MIATLWGWRKVGKNYPEHKDIKLFSIFKDVVEGKVKDLNNSAHDSGIKYELIEITIEEK